MIKLTDKGIEYSETDEDIYLLTLIASTRSRLKLLRATLEGTFFTHSEYKIIADLLYCKGEELIKKLDIKDERSDTVKENDRT